MDVAGVREALQKQPFEPLAMRLADVRSLPDPHSDFVAAGCRRVVVAAADDSWTIVKPLLIVSLDQLQRRMRNGKGKRQ